MAEPTRCEAVTEADLRRIAGELGRSFNAGDLVLLSGPLGAGKTTFVRGYLESIRHDGPVRSPTFNLIQVFDTVPPVVHADLYRVASGAGIGLEDYFGTHVCLIEWPERLGSGVDLERCWRIDITFAQPGRILSIQKPAQ